MTLRTNNNLMALTVQHAISGQSSRAIREVETLSSGIRVKRASNDASGVAISEGLRADLAGLEQNVRNVEQAANLLQVAQGSLQTTNRAGGRPKRNHAGGRGRGGWQLSSGPRQRRF